MSFPAPSEFLRSRARACLLGGAIGDALGAPIEFLKLSDIRKQFGPAGVRDFVAGEWPAGSITDDTQMTLFTAEGLLRGEARWASRGICGRMGVMWHAYRRWLLTQEGPAQVILEDSEPGFLLGVRELHARRAPGVTCLGALRSPPADWRADNDSKGCGGVMRVAAVGIYAARGGESNARAAFEFATECAALTHGHPTGSLAAGAFAALIAQLMGDLSLSEALEATCNELKRHSNHEETLTALEAAKGASQTAPSAESLERLGGGWIAEEALSMAVYCALVARTFEEGVLLAINHSGDSDSTGSIAGNLLGAIHGEAAIPRHWLDSLELRDAITRVAEDLCDFPYLRSVGNQQAAEFEQKVWEAYPGN